MNNKVLVLCSGGPDAAVVAAKIKRDGMFPTLLYFDYGQHSAQIEEQMVRSLAKDFDCPFMLVKTDAFSQIQSGLLKSSGASAAMTVAQGKVPARNFIFMAIAAGIAETNGFGYVMIGSINTEHIPGANPDQFPGFVKAVDEVLKYLTKGVVVRAFAPINLLTKVEVIRLGMELGVEFSHTWSCYNQPTNRSGDGPLPMQCGQCASCKARYMAFTLAGKDDPLPYAQVPVTLPA